MTDEEVMEHNSTEEIKSEIRRLETLRMQKAILEAEIEDIQKYLDKALDRDIEFIDEETGDRIRASVVRSTMDRFDEHLISTRYKSVWNLITKRHIDKELYKNAVKAGAITPEMNSVFHHEVPKKSFVKITHYLRGDDE